MPKVSEEFLLAKREEIIDACAKLYETMNLKEAGCMNRVLWDILMVALFLAVMDFHAIPKLLHEVLGLLLPLAVFVHLFLNRRWFPTLSRGKWDVMRVLGASVNFLLMMCLVLVAATGVCLSNHLFKDMIPLDLQRSITLHRMHVSLPFAMLILMGIHLGLHWQGWRQRLLNFFHGETYVYRIGSIVIGMAMVGTGIYASLQNRIGDRLLMKHIFATPATDLPGAIYALLLLAIFAMYACLGNWVREMVQHRGRGHEERQAPHGS